MRREYASLLVILPAPQLPPALAAEHRHVARDRLEAMTGEDPGMLHAPLPGNEESP